MELGTTNSTKRSFRNLGLWNLELRIQRKGHLGTWDYGTWNYELNEKYNKEMK